MLPYPKALRVLFSEQPQMSGARTRTHENERHFWSLRALESLSFNDLARRCKDSKTRMILGLFSEQWREA